MQGAAQPQNFGFGFMGQGTEISTVKRIYSEFLGNQVQTAQASKSGLDSYYAQIKQIDNLLADPLSGLSPALQDFFSGIQDVTSNPSGIPARQGVLSSAEALASRFQSLAGRLDEIEQGVNSQILSSVSFINTYAQQIASLNDAIGRAQRATGQPANDLLDQRDQLILDLNKEIKTTVVKQGDGNYNVFIGNGQPLVVGTTTYQLANVVSPTNPERIEVAFRASSGDLVIVGDVRRGRRQAGWPDRIPQPDPGARAECPGSGGHRPGRHVQCAAPARIRPQWRGRWRVLQCGRSGGGLEQRQYRIGCHRRQHRQRQCTDHQRLPSAI